MPKSRNLYSLFKLDNW